MESNQSPSKANQYFAAMPTEQLLPELSKRFLDYREFLKRSGILGRVKKSFNYYYGFSDKGNFTSSEIADGGKGGGLKLIKINQFRNLVQRVLTMTTAQRPALRTRAANTDYESQVQTILGDGLLDYYLREKRVERYLKQAAECALVLLEGFVVVDWNTEAGDAYGIDPAMQQDPVTGEETPVLDEAGQPKGKTIYEGDLQVGVHHMLNVARDFGRKQIDQDWVIIEEYKNRFDLAAQYPEKRDQILAVEAPKDQGTFRLWGQVDDRSSGDQVPVYTFRHRSTPACEGGKLVIYLNDQVSLFDGPFPYEDLPGGLGVYRISPSDFLDTSFGYSAALDSLSVQEALDALYSVVITNQTTFGVQNIMAPSGHNIAYSQLADGLNLIEYDKLAGPPEALELCKTPPEIFNFIPTLESGMRIMMGLNDVIMGDPQASLKSGSALALVASQAIQFNYEFQKSWAELLEDVGLAMLKLLQQRANTTRVAAIVGKHNLGYIKEFQGRDLKHINRVTVDIENPLSRTPEGRLEQANNLLNAQAVDAQQYLMVAQTGKIEPLVEARTSHLMLMRQENEAMRMGQAVPVLATDLHSEHIAEHSTLLDTPEARKNPQIAQAVLLHNQEHLNALRTVDPALLMMRGQQPLAPMMPPGMPPGEGPQQPAAQAPSADQQQAPNKPSANGKFPSQPSQPTNPLSGSKFDNSSGGM